MCGTWLEEKVEVATGIASSRDMGTGIALGRVYHLYRQESFPPYQLMRAMLATTIKTSNPQVAQ